ncbi:MAG: PIN/TRAM domain-containing protein [Candidatus Rifleibacteriota bacterium]
MIFQMLRSLLVLTGTLVGVSVGYGLYAKYPDLIELENPELTLAALLGFIGYLICSIAGRELQAWIENQLESTNSFELAWSALGILLGLVSANLLFIPVYFIMYKGYGDVQFDNKYIDALVPMFHLVIPLAFNLLFAFIGMKIIIKYRRLQTKINTTGVGGRPKVIDTSTIIDGRFADLYRLGFLEGDIIIPRFVINELQFLADSSDELKRSRGRKGLTSLNQLKTEFPDHVVIAEKDFDDINEVDAKLVRLAKELKGVMLTLDYNLKKVAELDQVKVLNLNDLANALKPIFISGEDIEVKIVKKGKEKCQGVGFLSDGTMVVIEDGGDHVGQTVKTTVSNILQTAAGRMIFCRIGDKKINFPVKDMEE